MENSESRMQWQQYFNRRLDRLARRQLGMRKRRWAAYRVCGYIGLLLAVGTACILVARLNLSYAILAGMVITAVATFLGLAMATKIIVGQERLIYYHHEIAVMLTVAGFLWMLDQPVWQYLDITIMGIGLFLVCGRLGCFCVGCCHGKPGPWGVCYDREHAGQGFSHSLVGVRLIPVQMLEMMLVLAILVKSGALLLTNCPPGSVVAWYVVAYDIVRFFLEFLRGDAGRPIWAGFSEGQWISVILMGGVVALEGFGFLPVNHWHYGATAGVMVLMMGIAMKRRFHDRGGHKLFYPKHIQEVIYYLDGAHQLTRKKDITVAFTSQDLKISKSVSQQNGSRTYHYSFSQNNGLLGANCAEKLLGVIAQIKHQGCAYHIVPGQQGVFHLLVNK